MKILLNSFYRGLFPVLKWVNPFFDLKKLMLSFTRYIKFFIDVKNYKKMPNAEQITIKNVYPCLHDRSSSTPFDRHYFYQDIWAFKHIMKSNTREHIDIGSRLIYVGMLSTVTEVTFIDIRPLNANLKNLKSKYGTIIDLPYQNNSVQSLSCLHVAEHIGLGKNKCEYF